MKISFSSNDSVQIVGGDGLFSKQESVGRFWLKELSDHTHLLSTVDDFLVFVGLVWLLGFLCGRWWTPWRLPGVRAFEVVQDQVTVQAFQAVHGRQPDTVVAALDGCTVGGLGGGKGGAGACAPSNETPEGALLLEADLLGSAGPVCHAARRFCTAGCGACTSYP